MIGQSSTYQKDVLFQSPFESSNFPQRSTQVFQSSYTKNSFLIQNKLEDLLRQSIQFGSLIKDTELNSTAVILGLEKKINFLLLNFSLGNKRQKQQLTTVLNFLLNHLAYYYLKQGQYAKYQGSIRRIQNNLESQLQQILQLKQIPIQYKSCLMFQIGHYSLQLCCSNKNLTREESYTISLQSLIWFRKAFCLLFEATANQNHGREQIALRQQLIARCAHIKSIDKLPTKQKLQKAVQYYFFQKAKHQKIKEYSDLQNQLQGYILKTVVGCELLTFEQFKYRHMDSTSLKGIIEKVLMYSTAWFNLGVETHKKVVSDSIHKASIHEVERLRTESERMCLMGIALIAANIPFNPPLLLQLIDLHRKQYGLNLQIKKQSFDSQLHFENILFPGMSKIALSSTTLATEPSPSVPQTRTKIKTMHSEKEQDKIRFKKKHNLLKSNNKIGGQINNICLSNKKPISQKKRGNSYVRTNAKNQEKDYTNQYGILRFTFNQKNNKNKNIVQIKNGSQIKNKREEICRKIRIKSVSTESKSNCKSSQQKSNQCLSHKCIKNKKKQIMKENTKKKQNKQARVANEFNSLQDYITIIEDQYYA